MKNNSIKIYRRIQGVVDTLHVFSENNQVYKKSNRKEWHPINFKWESIIE